MGVCRGCGGADLGCARDGLMGGCEATRKQACAREPTRGKFDVISVSRSGNYSRPSLSGRHFPSFMRMMANGIMGTRS